MTQRCVQNIYIFMGPPGSGKGTLSLMCVEKLGWGWLSTGDLCRFHIAQATQIGITVDSIVKSGNLIPDDLIVEMVFDWLMTRGAAYETIVLDGFPRTVAQADLLWSLIHKKYNASISMTVVQLLLSHQDAKQRLMDRYVCSSLQCQKVYTLRQLTKGTKDCFVCEQCSGNVVRRVDDTETVIQGRLDTYYTYEQKLLAFYQFHNVPVITCSTNKPVELVFNEFKNTVGCVSI